MRQYPAYPEYKPTGCDWFPDIPAHWKIDRAKWSVISCQNGVWGADPDGDDDLVCIRVADFDRQSLRISTEKLTMRSIAEKDRRNRLLKSGDLLLEKSGGGEQQLVGAVVEFDEPFPAVNSNFIARMVARDDMNSRFLVYLHSHLYSGRVNFRSIKQTTGIQNLDSQAYLDELITYPPLEEQKAIARFLDLKTAQIDGLIEKKKQLLDKLAEKRTALISHAVTKGLDLSVPMKASGVVWLGEVPSHWTIMRARYASTFVTSGSRGWAEYYSDSGSVFLRITNVSRDSVDLLLHDIQRVSPPESSEGKRTATQSGDVLVSITADLGSVAVIPDGFESAYVSQHLALVRPNADRVLGRWMAYQFFSTSGQAQLTGAGYGGTKIQLGLGDVKDVWLALPPTGEQEAICAWIGAEVDKLKCQSVSIRDVILRLSEYRSALITNAVTGKIDVRGFDIPQIAEEVAS
ncbi:restriction endonuclease subunit S [Achromobacter ruhlandii]|uniref:restriction endonuclease subunit S n=1 Tax=Achromobacter ruhlandii TaxID=72557 RepID=UPI0006C71377|nr:restriction endonuclease subunit S [Achromobacter ruhlandii]AVC42908.1 restriction endonuclease subunit S [Achromobacter xylosoxidans]CUI39272.1 Type I restriction enzyme EcoKI specificity protein [Achromobacter ruhlandii]CUI87603.1 Type I restriction enzyme EcoKI specificity protein [Achromobacter ruhlandii]CUJ84622.1 Type I restriction enzyme EcoKI specificity protein [Achromobacter ruhlandii]